jgi:two-component system sensor kinase FixL
LNDTLFDEETSRKLAEMQTRYEVVKKDREIEVLRKNEQIKKTQRNVILASAVLLLCLILLLYNRYRLKVRANQEIQNKNEALEVAQAAREKAFRAELAHVSRVTTMGELASALAHELNQPLTAILSNAQASRRFLASDRGDPAELDETLADIAEGAGRAREIIHRLRALIRRGDITTERLDINEALRAVEPFARTDARSRGVNLVMDLGAEPLPVTGDRIQLQQVLLNLVQNGAEAMKDNPEDDRDLLVTTSLKDPVTVVVQVRDSGPPLDDGTISSMFEPFYTTKQDGLGMGLPICRTIIEAHGGRLWASPDSDRGLTVQFSLPRG